MAETFDITFQGLERLGDAMEEYGQGAGQIIQGVYEDFAAKEIKTNISKVLPVSGRKFSGHRTGAKAAGIDRVFQHRVTGLDLIVQTKGQFGYLIFPDEGRGVHNPRAQRFMQRGLDASVDAIVDRCIARLAESLS